MLQLILELGKKEFVWLNKKYKELPGNLIIYFEGTLNATILKSFPNDSKIEEFKLPVLLWNFLDNLIHSLMISLKMNKFVINFRYAY